MLCEKTGAIMKIIPMNHDGELIFSEYEKLLSNKTKVVFVNHVSNAVSYTHLTLPTTPYV